VLDVDVLINGRYLSTRRFVRAALRLLSTRGNSGENAESVDDFYASSESCQIPSLSPLLSQFLGNRTMGSFVEVGGYDGISYSNTWGLAERGWSGLLIEPVKEHLDTARAAHAQHKSVSFLQIAISRPGLSEITLAVCGPLTSGDRDVLQEHLNTLEDALAVRPHALTVPALTLDQALIDSGVQAGFDLLVVDVEGHEADVFAGFSIADWQPRMIAVELTDTHTSIHASKQSHGALYQQLLKHDYIPIFKDSVNTLLVRRDVYCQGLLRPTEQAEIVL